MTDEARKLRGWRRHRPGLATQVLIGFVLGIGVGSLYVSQGNSLRANREEIKKWKFVHG
jgi:hypothetical protein